MSTIVWIPTELTVGLVESQMTYGAIIKYIKGGIEFHEMLAEDDYEVWYEIDLDEIREWYKNE